MCTLKQRNKNLLKSIDRNLWEFGMEWKIYIYVLKGDMHLGKKLLSEKFPTLDQDHSQK